MVAVAVVAARPDRMRLCPNRSTVSQLRGEAAAEEQEEVVVVVEVRGGDVEVRRCWALMRLNTEHGFCPISCRTAHPQVAERTPTREER
jgi:hypothetical protein